MKRWERWSFNGFNLVVAITGIAYFIMKYLLATDDPFAVVNHPWQSMMLSAHVLAAPGVILLFGIVMRSHVLRKLASNYRPDRRTGWTTLVSFGTMALSGYLLQVASSPIVLDAMVVLHVGSSAVFLLGYTAHLVIGWRLLRAPVSVPASEPSVPDAAQLPS